MNHTLATHPANTARPSIEGHGRPRGAVILAGSHGAIALARTLARQGLDVWFLTNFTPLPRFSNAVAHSRTWPGAEDPSAPDFLEQLAQSEGLAGYLLIPAADSDVQMAAQHRDRLSRHFTVLLPDWQALQWACDKGLASRRATELGLAVPQVYDIAGPADAEAADLSYPVVLKPAMRIALNRFTRAKVWRADDRDTFLRLYREAAALVGPEGIVVQELVPGGGECQFSYAGLWWHGEPVTCFTARRTRQFPVDFSYTSTFVETVEEPDVVAAAEAFLRSIGHHGLVEIEFKRDPRTGALKLLDVNPRPWSWFGLAQAAGVDFGAAITALCSGRSAPPMQARPGVGWMFFLRDLVVAAQLAGRGELDVGQWLASLGRTRTFASLSLRDPLPGLVELPLTLVRVVARSLPSRR